MNELTDVFTGTVYNGEINKIRYIVIYNNEPYILFKDRTLSGTIMGISIDETQDESRSRKIVTISIDDNYMYKYIP